MMSTNVSKDFLKKDILSSTFLILDNTSFSHQTDYVSFKTKYSRLNVIRNTRSLNLKLKISKSKFKKLNNLGVLNGFYRAMW
jgi:hypothetical protein